MYYEERIIGDSIYFRTDPRGKWQCKEEESVAFKLLRKMSLKRRQTVLNKFCSYCGKEGSCVCMRDD